MTALQAIGGAELDRRLAPAGALAQEVEALHAAVWRQPHLPAAVLELCRLHLAMQHRVEAELRPAPGTDAAKAAAVLADRWADDASISAAERAALEFTAYYVLDVQSISDAVAAKVVEHFGEPGLVALLEALGVLDGRLRLQLLFGRLDQV